MCSISDCLSQQSGDDASQKLADDAAFAERCNSVVREIEQLGKDLTKTHLRLQKARNAAHRGRVRLSRLVTEKGSRSAPQLEQGETALAQAVLAAQQRAKSDLPATRPLIRKIRRKRLPERLSDQPSTSPSALSIRKLVD